MKKAPTPAAERIKFPISSHQGLLFGDCHMKIKDNSYQVLMINSMYRGLLNYPVYQL